MWKLPTFTPAVGLVILLVASLSYCSSDNPRDDPAPPKQERVNETATVSPLSPQMSSLPRLRPPITSADKRVAKTPPSKAKQKAKVKQQPSPVSTLEEADEQSESEYPFSLHINIRETTTAKIRAPNSGLKSAPMTPQLEREAKHAESVPSFTQLLVRKTLSPTKTQWKNGGGVFIVEEGLPYVLSCGHVFHEGTREGLDRTTEAPVEVLLGVGVRERDDPTASWYRAGEYYLPRAHFGGPESDSWKGRAMDISLIPLPEVPEGVQPASLISPSVVESLELDAGLYMISMGLSGPPDKGGLLSPVKHSSFLRLTEKHHNLFHAYTPVDNEGIQLADSCSPVGAFSEEGQFFVFGVVLSISPDYSRGYVAPIESLTYEWIKRTAEIHRQRNR